MLLPRRYYFIFFFINIFIAMAENPIIALVHYYNVYGNSQVGYILGLAIKVGAPQV